MNFRRIGWIFVLAAMLFVQSPALSVVCRIEGTRVSMDQPLGFTRAKNFPGFAKEEDQASIMVVEVPGPYDKVTAGFNAPMMATRGMELLAKESHPVGKYPGIFLQVNQSAAGQLFSKWILAFGDQQKTVMVTGTYPAAAKELSEPIKNSVLSTTYDASGAPPSPTADLPFTISGGAFKLANRLGNTLVFTPSGRLTGNTKAGAFMVGQALSDLDVGDKAVFARRRIRQTANVSNIEILGEADTKVGGMPAREIVAKAVGKQGDKVFLYQTIAYGMGSYFILVGMGPLDQRQTLEQQFRTITSTFRTK